MLELIHVSDSHFHKDDIKNTNSLNKLKQLKNIINDKSIIILTGDAIDDAEEKQLNTFSDSINRIGLRTNLMLTIGNHDLFKFGNQIDSITSNEDAVIRFQKIQMFYLCSLCENHKDALIHEYNVDYFEHSIKLLWFNIFKTSKVRKKMITVELSTEKSIFIILDSNPTKAHGINFARGDIGKKQLSMLKKIINDNKYNDWCKIVLLHHHPIDNSYFLKLEDSDDFLKLVWNTADLVLFGHKHEWNLWSNNKAFKYDGYISSAKDLASSSVIPYTKFIIENGKVKSCETLSL